MNEVETRARLSGGSSDEAVHRMVLRALGNRSGEVLLDVGCGSGHLWTAMKGRFKIGTDNANLGA